MTARQGGALLCLVTDRRLFPDQNALLDLIRAAAAAGVDLVQIREPDLPDRSLLALVTAACAVARGTRTRVVVNERTDVALAAGADGVHLRADSVPAHRVRGLAPHGFLIGRSVHSVDEAVRLSPGADYLIAGTVFPTPSKPAARQWLGPENLRAVVERVTAPVLAIGGVAADTVGEIAAAGAAGLAGIRVFADACSNPPFDAPVRQVVEQLQAAFAVARSSGPPG